MTRASVNDQHQDFAQRPRAGSDVELRHVAATTANAATRRSGFHVAEHAALPIGFVPCAGRSSTRPPASIAPNAASASIAGAPTIRYTTPPATVASTARRDAPNDEHASVVVSESIVAGAQDCRRSPARRADRRNRRATRPIRRRIARRRRPRRAAAGRSRRRCATADRPNARRDRAFTASSVRRTDRSAAPDVREPDADDSRKTRGRKHASATSQRSAIAWTRNREQQLVRENARAEASRTASAPCASAAESRTKRCRAPARARRSSVSEAVRAAVPSPAGVLGAVCGRVHRQSSSSGVHDRGAELADHDTGRLVGDRAPRPAATHRRRAARQGWRSPCRPRRTRRTPRAPAPGCAARRPP